MPLPIDPARDRRYARPKIGVPLHGFGREVEPPRARLEDPLRTPHPCPRDSQAAFRVGGADSPVRKDYNRRLAGHRIGPLLSKAFLWPLTEALP